MNVWGAEIRPPSLDRGLAAWLLRLGLMGRAQRRFFESAVTRGHTVVDVGANQGIFTLLFSKLVGHEGQVVALEPEPTLFAALDSNCRLNAADNVRRLQVAAGRARAQGILHCSRFNGGDNRLTPSLNGRSVPVEVVSLDDVLADQRVDLIKIDVQGYEVNVVHGMQGLLNRGRAIKVFFEYWPAGLGYAGSAPGELPDFFLSRGFSLFEFKGDGLQKVSGADLARSTQTGERASRDLLAARD